jgi:hypothetical protein
MLNPHGTMRLAVLRGMLSATGLNCGDTQAEWHFHATSATGHCH